MNDDIICLIYYFGTMETFKNHIKPFGLLKKQIETDPMAPKYIKPDGTKVIEQYDEFGKTVYEISPKGLLISRRYIGEDILIMDYARRANLEIGHKYDEDGRVIYEFNFLYDEHNVLARKNEIEFKYHDNGKKSQETIINTPGNIKIVIKYDETGTRLEKVEHRGSVKTYYDKNDKPFKREIDRGSGGIITEEL